jgi:hypothetical protein
MVKRSCIFALICIAMFIAARAIHQGMAYFEGATNGQGTIASHIFLWMFLLFGLIVVASLGTLALAIYLLFCIGDSAGRRLRIAAIGTVLLTMVVGTAWGCASTARPGANYFLEGFKQFADQNADLQAIRSWQPRPDNENFVPSVQWPEAVARLSPQYVQARAIQGSLETTLTFGGGFMHWGIIVRSGPNAARLREHDASVETILLNDWAEVWVSRQ